MSHSCNFASMRFPEVTKDAIDCVLSWKQPTEKGEEHQNDLGLRRSPTLSVWGQKTGAQSNKLDHL